MSETPITYTFGTGVWVKVVNRYWWPGIVVDPLTVPDELLEYVNKVNPIAVVKFVQEDKYEIVIKKENIFLYSCDRKMEFVEKGLSLLKNQKKGIVGIVGKFKMDNFEDAVISMEKRFGGDVRIFINLEKKQEDLKTFVKQLFTPTNTKKSKKKEVSRKSLPTPIIPKLIPSPVSRQKTLPQSKVVQHLVPSKISPVPMGDVYTCSQHVGCTYTTKRYTNLKYHMSMPQSNTNQKIVKKSPASTSNKRKNVKTKLSDRKKIKLQEELLKDWENEGEDEDVELNAIDVQSTSQVVETTNQDVPIKNNSLQITGEVVPTKNEDLQITSEVVPTKNESPQITSEVVPIINEGLQITGEVVPIINEVVQMTSKIAPTLTEDMSTGEVLSSENDLIPTLSEVIPIANEIQETNTSSPNKVFEFNENDDNTPVVELRQNKLDSSSTVVDDITEKSEPGVISDLSNNTIPGASTNESLLVEETKKDSNELLLAEETKKDSNELLLAEETKKDTNESLVAEETKKDTNESLVAEETKNDSNESLLVEETKKDFFNETREIHSNEEIDDQTKNTNILLEKTVNTLDQISFFENSLSCISNSINKSDANILTEDNNVVDVSDFIECESLKEPTSPNKDIHIETGSTDVLVKNISVQTEDHEIVKQKTIQNEILSDDEEVNQSNRTAIENSCSVDSVSNVMECENETTKERDNQESLLDIVHVPSFFKEDSWETFEHNGNDKAKLFAVDSKKPIYLCDSGKIHTGLNDLTPFKTVFSSEINEMTDADRSNLKIEFFVPCKMIQRQTLEELNASPIIQSQKLLRERMNLIPMEIRFQPI